MEGGGSQASADGPARGAALLAALGGGRQLQHPHAPQWRRRAGMRCALAAGPTYPHTVPTAAPPLPPACLPPYPLLREAVGSKEGWQPSEFRSSRGMRAAVQQSVEQFLDDDELEDLRKTNLQVGIEWKAGHWWELQGGWLAGWEVVMKCRRCGRAAGTPLTALPTVRRAVAAAAGSF